MDARCEVCGVVADISDEELARHLVHFECLACGTPHYATRKRCCRTGEAKKGGRGTRARSGPTSRPGTRKPPPLPDADRLSDIRALARQSLLPPEPRTYEDVVEAPASIRSAIRLSDPPLGAVATPSAAVVAWTRGAGGDEPRLESRARTVALGIVGALVVAAVMGWVTQRDGDPAALASSGVAVSGLAVGGHVASSIRVAQATPPPAEPDPGPRAEKTRPAHRASAPAGARAAEPSAAPSAAAAAPSSAAQPSARPPMTLQEAIAQAAGKSHSAAPGGSR